MSEEFSFLNYDKFTDTLVYLSPEITLNFCVSLSRKNRANEVLHFHSEYGFMSKNLGKKSYSIKRNILPYFAINDSKNFENSIMIRPQDITLLQMILNNNILPWFIGPKRIYGFDNDNKMIIKGKWSPVDFPLSDYKFISFSPIVCDYQDGTSKEGIRMIINDKNNFIDMDISKFMEFYYYINNTDMYNAAIGILNYVKTGPYLQNYHDLDLNNNSYNDSNDWNMEKQSGGKKTNYFDNIK